MRYLLPLALALAGCCSSPDPAPGAAGVDFEPVIAQPVRGICIPIPLTGCKVCLGVSCDAPPLIEPAVFGQPVQREVPGAAADPCAPVYAAPCGSASGCEDGSCDAPAYSEAWGSASDDYGVPPALGR